jgi:hypothetical protein
VNVVTQDGNGYAADEVLKSEEGQQQLHFAKHLAEVGIHHPTNKMPLCYLPKTGKHATMYIGVIFIRR